MVRTDIDDNVVYVKEKDALNQGLFTQLKVSGNINEYELVTSGVGGVLVGDATTSTKGVVELALDGENSANVVVQGNDSRLNNDRFPTAHAYTHKSGGSDEIRVDELKEGQDVTTLDSSSSRHGLAMKLSGNSNHYYRGDGTWNIPPGAGTIPASETDAGIVELAANNESAAGLAVQANDSRLTDDRFPTDHSTTHNKDGSDAFAKTDILHAIARFVETLGTDPTVDTGRIFINLTDLKYWDDTAGTPVKQTVEILSHKNTASGYAGLDGSSKVAVANLPAASTSSAGISELATDGENAANVVVQGNDSRLSNARTPTAHKVSHEAGGGDELHVDTIGSGTNITTNDVSTSKHGLAPKAPNDTSKFLRGDATWAIPPDVGEANTYSNAGSGGIGVTLTKAGVDLPFKSVKANSTKIAVTDGGVNNNVLIDATEANFNLANIGGTAAWTQVSKTGSVVGDIADTTISSPAQYEVLMRNGSSKWINSKLDNNSIAAAAAIAYSKLSLTGSIVNNDVSGSAAIAYSKLALSLSIVNGDIAAGAAIAKSKLASLDVVNADVNASAGIVYSKLSLTGGILNADVNASAAIAKSKLASLDIINADVNASAAIAYSKLNLATSIVNADVSGSAAIAYSKLNLATSIANGDIAVAAAIAYSKLALNDSIVNADINTSAAIAWSKISKTGSALSDIEDVDLTGIADGDSIMWDSGTSTWVVYTPGVGGGGGATDLEGLTDVDLTTPAQYHVLQYGAGTNWVNALLTNNNIDATAAIAKSKLAALAIVNSDVDASAAIAWSKISKTGSTLTDIDDVDTTGVGDGDILVWDSGSSTWTVDTPVVSPINATYLTLSTNASLGAERVLTAGTNISFTDGGANSTLTVDIGANVLTTTNTKTMTNKTIAAGSNTVSGIVDANIDAHTSTKITITDKAQLNSAIIYTDQTNTFGDFSFIFKDNRLIINNPADTFSYVLVAAAIAGNRTINLPLLTASDTMVTEAFIQTLTNKTMSGASNTFINIPYSALTSVPTTFTPSAHKDSHKSGGTDPFAKADVLNAPSRYLEEVADPASDSGRIWINSNSEQIEYWDTTTGTPVQRTVANLLSSQEFKNKTIDASLQTSLPKFAISPQIKDWGQLAVTFGGVSTYGGIATNYSAVGTVTGAFDTSHGYRAIHTSAAAAGSNAGQNNQVLTHRAWNPYFRTKFALPSTTNHRFFIGFYSSPTLTANVDTFLDNKSGVGIGFRTSDSNWMVFNNDGGATQVASTLGTGTAKDTAVHAVEIKLNDSVPNAVINFYGAAGLLQTATVTSRLPATLTSLNQPAFASRSDATSAIYWLYNMWIEHTRTVAPL